MLSQQEKSLELSAVGEAEQRVLTLKVTSYRGRSVGDQVVKRFDDRGGSIGRAGSSDWVLSDDERFISGLHAEIECRGGSFFLIDQSTNGTFFNGADRPMGKGREQRLADGDWFQIGDYEIAVSVTIPDEPRADETDQRIDASSNDLPGFGNPPGANGIGPRGSVDPLDLIPNNAPRQDGEGRPPAQRDDSPAIRDPIDLPPLGQPAPAQPRADAPDSAPAHAREANEPRAGSPAAEVLSGSDAGAGGPGGDVIPPDWWKKKKGQAGSQGAAEPSNSAARRDQDPFAANEPSRPLARSPDESVSPPPRPAAEPAPRPASSAPAADSSSPEGAPQQPASPRTGPTEPAQAESWQAEPQRQPSQQRPDSQPPASAAAQDGGMAGRSDEASALIVLLEAAGMDPASARAAASPRAAAMIGSMLNVVVQGMLDVLRARAEIKAQFRVPVTTIRPEENNPLKFSATVAQALKSLLQGGDEAYLGPVDAFSEGFADIKAHQMAMLAGMRAAYEAVVGRFDPNELTERFDRQSKRGALLGMSGKGRYWDMYTELYESSVRGSDDNFQRLFGDEFARAYEEQMRLLTAARK